MELGKSKLINTINGKKTLDFNIRPNTTDIKVIKEVINSNVYQRKNIKIEKEDIWLDLGGNIGTFSVLVMSQGSKFYSYEPEPENFKILKSNIELNKKIFKGQGEIYEQGVSIKSGIVKLYLCKGDINKYRHTIIKRRGRKSIDIRVITLNEILKKHKDINSIKMDIEGIEIDILENFNDWDKYKIKKLVFEYSFDFDRSIKRFYNIIESLKPYFSIINFSKKVDKNKLEYNYFPAAVNVYCTK